MFDFVSTADYIEVNSQIIDIQNVTLKKSCYDPNTEKVFGSVIAKRLEFDIPSEVSLEGSTFTYYAITYNANGDGENTMVGTFVARKATVSNTEELTHVLAFDLMINASIPFTTELSYPVTMNDLLNEGCTKCGLALYPDVSLVNGSFIIDSAPDADTWRDVFAGIAQVNGTYATIKNDMLAFITPDMNAEAAAEITPDYYDTITVQEQTTAIDTVVIRDTLMGESTTSGAGNSSLYIDNNIFATTAAKREAMIEGILGVVFGFTYYPFVAKGIADPLLEAGDAVRVMDKEGNEYMSFCLDMTYRSTGAEKSLLSYTSAPAVSKTAVPMVYALSPAEKAARRAMQYVSGLQPAIDAATAALNAPGGSHVRMIPDITNPSEIYIMDTEDTATATNVLRLNSAGWGISHTGYAGPYTVAAFGDSLLSRIITAGKVTADDISAGTISAAVIFAGTLAAASGTFTHLIAGLENAQRLDVGFDENNEPYLDMYDNTNTKAWSWRKSYIAVGSVAKLAPYTVGTKSGFGIFVG